MIDFIRRMFQVKIREIDQVKVGGRWYKVCLSCFDINEGKTYYTCEPVTKPGSGYYCDFSSSEIADVTYKYIWVSKSSLAGILSKITYSDEMLAEWKKNHYEES